MSEESKFDIWSKASKRARSLRRARRLSCDGAAATIGSSGVTRLRGVTAWCAARIVQNAEIGVRYHSIRIVGMCSDSESFQKAAGDALSLIERKDLTAWQMVKREVVLLRNGPLLGGGGQYVRNVRMCAVDYERSYTNRNEGFSYAYLRDWYVATLASTIVHEAMHGRLFSLGIPYSRYTRARVERLCVLRQRRFLAKLNNSNYDLMRTAAPFDSARWAPYGNFKSRLALGWELILRVWRDDESKSPERNG